MYHCLKATRDECESVALKTSESCQPAKLSPILTICLTLAAGLLVAFAGAAHAADHVTVGVASAISDASIFIAAPKRYFQNESLDVSIVNFRAATEIVPMLATGHADIVAVKELGPYRRSDQKSSYSKDAILAQE